MRVDEGHVDCGVDLDCPEGGGEFVHPEDLFLHCAGGGHFLRGEELVPAWAAGLR